MLVSSFFGHVVVTQTLVSRELYALCKLSVSAETDAARTSAPLLDGSDKPGIVPTKHQQPQPPATTATTATPTSGSFPPTAQDLTRFRRTLVCQVAILCVFLVAFTIYIPLGHVIAGNVPHLSIQEVHFLSVFLRTARVEAWIVIRGLLSLPVP